MFLEIFNDHNKDSLGFTKTYSQGGTTGTFKGSNQYFNFCFSIKLLCAFDTTIPHTGNFLLLFLIVELFPIHKSLTLKIHLLSFQISLT